MARAEQVADADVDVADCVDSDADEAEESKAEATPVLLLDYYENDTDDEDNDPDYKPSGRASQIEQLPTVGVAAAAAAVEAAGSSTDNAWADGFVISPTFLQFQRSSARSDLVRRYLMVQLCQVVLVSYQQVPVAMLYVLLAVFCAVDFTADADARGRISEFLHRMCLLPSALSLNLGDFAAADRLLLVREILSHIPPAMGTPNTPSFRPGTLFVHIGADDSGRHHVTWRILVQTWWNPVLGAPDLAFICIRKAAGTSAPELFYMDWTNLCRFLQQQSLGFSATVSSVLSSSPSSSSVATTSSSAEPAPASTARRAISVARVIVDSSVDVDIGDADSVGSRKRPLALGGVEADAPGDQLQGAPQRQAVAVSSTAASASVSTTSAPKSTDASWGDAANAALPVNVELGSYCGDGAAVNGAEAALLAKKTSFPLYLFVFMIW